VSGALCTNPTAAPLLTAELTGRRAAGWNHGPDVLASHTCKCSRPAGVYSSMLAVFERHALALSVDVGFERPQLRVIGVQRLALDWILDAPVDHISQ